MIDQFSDRDLGELLPDTIDLNAQVLAVRAMLDRNRQADEDLSQAIKRLDKRVRETQGGHARHLVEFRVDELHRSVYQSAATSAAAVGMLAPLFESLFREVAAGLLKAHGPEIAKRVENVRAPKDRFDPWNPQHYFGKGGAREDVISGIVQLAKATGMRSRMPPDFPAVIQALFSYRNKMLHQGFEWSLDTRHGFIAQIADQRWPGTWFEHSSTGDDPWVIYMTDELIDRCLALVDEVLAAAGGVHRELLEARPVVSPEEFARIIANPENLLP